MERLRQEKHKLTQQLQQEGQKCIAAMTQRDVFYVRSSAFQETVRQPVSATHAVPTGLCAPDFP